MQGVCYNERTLSLFHQVIFDAYVLRFNRDLGLWRRLTHTLDKAVKMLKNREYRHSGLDLYSYQNTALGVGGRGVVV